MLEKVLIIDSVHDIIPFELGKNNFEIIYAIDWSREKILGNIKDFYGVILRSRIKIDKEIIDRAENLRFVARVGAGMESIDTGYCKEKGIVCLNSPEGNRSAVAEHAIGMLLSLFNKLNKADREVKSGIWQRESNRGIELNDKTVGVIGYGNMGSTFAKYLSGFGCEVLSYDKYKFDYTDQYAKESALDNIFEKADILSLHVPLTDETNYMVDEDFICGFKKPFFLINTSRGPVVKTSALVEAIKTKKILGAGLDVIEYEESSFETTRNMSENEEFKFLSGCENVILTPHIAGWTNESKEKLAEVLVNKILEFKNNRYDNRS